MHDATLLKRHGLPATVPRIRVLSYFRERPNWHACAESVFQLLMHERISVSTATVYRILSDLERTGFIRRSVFNSTKIYYEWDDGVPHDHVMCVECGHIENIPESVVFNATYLKQVKELGYGVKCHSLTVHGACMRESCEHGQAKKQSRRNLLAASRPE